MGVTKQRRRAFITGVAGQDGRILAARLLGEGMEVHGLIFDDDDGAASLPAGVIAHHGNLGDPGGIRSLVLEIAADEVYNLGGISSVAFSWKHPALTGLVSGVGAVAVMDAARELRQSTNPGVRVLQASSSEIFGHAERAPQTETTPLAPVSPYGAAKAYAHQHAAMFRAEGLPVSTVILYNHESPERPETFVTRKITAGAARIAKHGGTLSLGNLEARRDWGWAPDYVDAMVRAIRHPVADDYVIATGETHSVADFAEAAFRHAGITDWRAHVVVDPALVRPLDPAMQVGDATKARETLGWQPTVNFDQLVKNMVDHDLALLS